MKIKKFKARNFPEALRLVKQELSEHAIILASEEKRGLRPYVEVTAAIDYEAQNTRPDSTRRNDVFMTNPAYRAGESSCEGLMPGVAAYGQRNPSAAFLIGENDYQPRGANGRDIYAANPLHREERGGAKQRISPPLKKTIMLNYLRERSIREEFALRLCETARDLDEIPRAIAADIRVEDHHIFHAAHPRWQDGSSGAKILMFTGPTGVGKTTTIAKLAARAVKNGWRTAIISLDTYRIGAIEQARIYARIMGIPLSIASNGTEFRNSLSQFSATRDVVFIDTSGRNPHCDEHIKDILDIVNIGFPLELHLLMSANYDDEFMAETFRSYGKLPVDYVSITKIDESVRFGSLYNLFLIYQRPVAFLTTGQKVPDDIEPASVSKLVDLILRKGCHAC